MEANTPRLCVQPIGVIHSPFTEQKGTPVQPYSAKDTRGTVELSESFTDGLLDLEGFERIWLIYWFDRAKPAEMTSSSVVQGPMTADERFSRG